VTRMIAPVIFGLEGQQLTSWERGFFKECEPAGYILFNRNCNHPDQVRRLNESLLELSGSDLLPILVDQEGGRVARLGLPHWNIHPPAAHFGALYKINPVRALEAVHLTALAIALELRTCGFTIDCIPLLDVPIDEADPIIGDRAYSQDPWTVANLGAACLDGLNAGGIAGVIKHIPGHGRALVDSHLELPVVDAPHETIRDEWLPFYKLAKRATIAMSAHIVYPSLDPGCCATFSSDIINGVIRDSIGFKGLLMSDDIGMKALSGSFADRSLRCLDAGCDLVLHCSGDAQEMEEIAANIRPAAPDLTKKLDQALAPCREKQDQPALQEIIRRRDILLSE